MNNEKDPHFYNFLSEENIICGLNAETEVDAIAELCGRLVKNNEALNAEEVVEAVIEREKIIPTVVGPGLAVPHARLEKADGLLVALGTSRSGLNFKVPGMPLVNVAILILTPKDDPGLHLQVMAALARDFKEPDTVRRIAAMENPKEILNYFTSNKLEIPEYLRAKDVMNHSPVTLGEGDTLKTVIETFATTRVMDIPVIDSDGDIRGIISIEDILKQSLPEHLLWMDDLTPILHFQPFAEMLRADTETRIADFLRDDYIVVEDDIPAIQLAKIFIMKNARQILVTNPEGKFSGVVNSLSFVTKLFWA